VFGAPIGSWGTMMEVETELQQGPAGRATIAVSSTALAFG
jgi:hypothetical protein